MAGAFIIPGAITTIGAKPFVDEAAAERRHSRNSLLF
jgi:hypothetical protein